MARNTRIVCLSVIGIIATILVFSSCTKNDGNAQTKDELHGKWEIKQALRDGRETSTLDNLYMEFKESEMQTNLFGKDHSFPYELAKNKISQKGDHEMEYKILEHSDTSLVLTTKIQEYAFQFDFRKTGR